MGADWHFSRPTNQAEGLKPVRARVQQVRPYPLAQCITHALEVPRKDIFTREFLTDNPPVYKQLTLRYHLTENDEALTDGSCSIGTG